MRSLIMDPNSSESSNTENMESGTDTEHFTTRIEIRTKSLTVTNMWSRGASHPLMRQGTDLILARAKCQQDANRDPLSSFLQQLKEDNASIEFIKTARSDISTIFAYITGIRLGEDPLIKAKFKALAKESPQKPRKKKYADPEPIGKE
ncbi:MAG: hypothetical protein EZS28_008348 [Streblomastix strix]|uniref:Uncharacterized protein n=1 Tax=Streblomastix strix TaxID=222440 RepID=A0A5J4WNC3_9EUKA|nr:MAG: hypothetical protein EZS28_008348 [Streblomastix strix]